MLRRREYHHNIIQTGTEAYPFLIYTVEDFVNFRNNFATGVTDYENVYHKLMNDLDLTGVSSFLRPVYDSKYCGHFDGNYHILNGITMMSFDVLSDCFGIFLDLYGSVRRLGIKNAYVSNIPFPICGVFAGQGFYPGIIEECCLDGYFNQGGAYCGFIAGVSVGLQIKNCCVKNMYANLMGGGYPNFSAGGIVAAVMEETIIDKCIVMNDMKLGNVAGMYLGGIMGRFYDNTNNVIENCVAAMSTLNSNNKKCGRIVGDGNNNNNCRNNYALNTMLVDGTTTTNDENSKQGKDATILQLKSQSFYENVLGWDFDSIWEIDEGIDFPKLKNFNL